MQAFRGSVAVVVVGGSAPEVWPQTKTFVEEGLSFVLVFCDDAGFLIQHKAYIFGEEDDLGIIFFHLQLFSFDGFRCPDLAVVYPELLGTHGEVFGEERVGACKHPYVQEVFLVRVELAPEGDGDCFSCLGGC